MAKVQGSNNYLNENYALIENDNKIREIDSNFKAIGFTSSPAQISEKQYWYESQDIFNILWR